MCKHSTQRIVQPTRDTIKELTKQHRIFDIILEVNIIV